MIDKIWDEQNNNAHFATSIEAYALYCGVVNGRQLPEEHIRRKKMQAVRKLNKYEQCIAQRQITSNFAKPAVVSNILLFSETHLNMKKGSKQGLKFYGYGEVVAEHPVRLTIRINYNENDHSAEN